MMEQTHWMIGVEYEIKIICCIDGVINVENVATDWL